MTIVALGLAAAFAARWPNVDRAAADRIVLDALEEYAVRERLARPNFSETDVAKQGDTWLYLYRYSAEPKHDLAISVYRDGRAEVSRMFDEVSRKAPRESGRPYRAERSRCAAFTAQSETARGPYRRLGTQPRPLPSAAFRVRLTLPDTPR